MIPLVPFNTMFHFRHSRLFFALKTIRVTNVMTLLDTKAFMKNIKQFMQQKLEKDILDKHIANDMDQDHNNIVLLIVFGNSFKLFRLVILIVMISYFVGIYFYIFCDLTDNLDAVRAQGKTTTNEFNKVVFTPPAGSGENFIDLY